MPQAKVDVFDAYLTDNIDLLVCLVMMIDSAG
jgi:hypothetical protein